MRRGVTAVVIISALLGSVAITPESFAKIVKETEFKNTKVKVFNYKKIQKKELGLIEAV